MLYLELRCRPFREIIRERRLEFLHYILNHDPKSLMNRSFQKQLTNRTNRVWVSTVLRDLEYFRKEGMSMEDIRQMKKGHFMEKLKRKLN